MRCTGFSWRLRPAAYPDQVSRTRLVALGTAVVIAGSGILVATGVTLRDSLLLTGAIGLQVWAGGYLWRVLSGKESHGPRDPITHLGSGLALGTAASVLIGAVATPWIPSGLGWLAFPALAGAVWFIRRLRGLSLAASYWRLRASTVAGFLVAVAAGALTLAVNVSRYPLAGGGPWTTYHRDMLYFEGLSTSTAVFGPNDSIFMSGADIRYHWLTYGWAGQLAHTVGAEPFVVLTRVLPLVALLGCAALVVSWTARLADRWPATVLAAVGLTLGGYLGAANGTILNFDSPSQNLSTLWLLGSLVCALAYIQGSSRRWSLVGLAALAAATTGGKISAALVALVPLAFVAFVLAVRRDPRWRRSVLASAVAAVAVLVAYVVVVAGSASPGDLQFLSWYQRASSIQGLDSSPGVRGIILGTITLMMAMAARWWGVLGLAAGPRSRHGLDAFLAIGLVAAGLVPVALLSQGLNETWFALSASAPLVAISAAGLALAWAPLRNRAAMVAAVALGLAVVLIVPVFWIPDVIYPSSVRFFGPWVGYAIAVVGGLIVGLSLGRQARLRVAAVAGITIVVFAGSFSRLSPVIADILHPRQGTDIVSGAPADAGDGPAGEEASIEVVPLDSVDTSGESPLSPPEERVEWGNAEDDAARFVRSNVAKDAILVTNETTSFLVPSLTQRRTYISGSLYQSLYSRAQWSSQIQERSDGSLAFTRALDEGAFSELCEAGVTWGWVALDSTPLRSWEPFASTEYANEQVAVIRLDRESCP